MGIIARSSVGKKSNGTMRLLLTTFLGIIFGFVIGVSFPGLSFTKLNMSSNFLNGFDFPYIDHKRMTAPFLKDSNSSASSNVGHGDMAPQSSSIAPEDSSDPSKIWVATNPRGAERLPPGIVVDKSDLFLRRLWGLPNEDLPYTPKYLATFTVGFNQRHNIDRCVKKFSDNFTILLFHYDGRVNEWDEFDWSKKAIHVSVKKQTKWWYAKRFLHPDIVAPYEYVFIWDEDLGVEHFNAEEYVRLIKKHSLEISQPGLESIKGFSWQMTKRRGDREVHKQAKDQERWCANTHQPPCAGFVEIMAPVFSRDAWRCVWYMIQNDLVHGWGLDFALRKCVEPAHEKIGVVDSQWIIHQTFPTLGNQGESNNGNAPWKGVRERCKKEWTMFQSRLTDAENAYFQSLGANSSNTTAH